MRGVARFVSVWVALLSLVPLVMLLGVPVAIARHLAQGDTFAPEWWPITYFIAIHALGVGLGVYAAYSLFRLRASGWWAAVIFLLGSIVYVVVSSWTDVFGKAHSRGADVVLSVCVLPLALLMLPGVWRASAARPRHPPRPNATRRMTRPQHEL